MLSSSYETAREQECMARLERAIERFADQYDNHLSGNRKTIFLFPGGMASQLVRADRRFDRPKPFQYGVSWMQRSVLVGGARNLAVEASRLDVGGRFVLPDGAIDFDCPGASLHPYARFARWCQDNSLHLFVFGWDWRLGVDRAARFFLDTFLPEFEKRLGKLNPLEDFTLIGHSAGGMVVKTILNQTNNRYVGLMKRAITVGTPFYGYGEQIRLYIMGHNILNSTIGGPETVRTLIRIISSLPGGYEFMFMDEATFDRNKAAFRRDGEEFKLLAYPSVDRHNPSVIADPFHPVSESNTFRYPPDLGFNPTLLRDALAVSQSISAPLDRSVAPKLFNVRGVQTTKAGVVRNNTVVGIKWRRVARDFNPDRAVPDPVKNVLGAGDGVQPAWGARLLNLPKPKRQVITVRGGVEHANLMNDDLVLEAIAPILGLDPSFVSYPAVTSPKAASRRKLDGFLKRLREITATYEPPEQRRAALDAFLNSYKPAERQGILWRAYLDLHKGPRRTDAG